MSKYKVGDKVVIHSLEYLKSIDTGPKNGSILFIPGGLSFIAPMRSMCGKTVTISYANKERYRIQESLCAWTDEMIAGSANINLGEIYE